MKSNTSYSKNKLARIISTIFIPPTFTLIIFLTFALQLENESGKMLLTILIALIFGFIAPIVLFLFLRKSGKIIDIDASIKEERTFPFLIAIIFYLIGLALMIYFDLNIIIKAFWFCYVSNTFLTIIINRFWKISAHSMGVSGSMAGLYFVLGCYSFLLIPLIFIIGWSRIKLKCHTFLQVLVGTILAYASTFFQMYIIINYFS